MITHFINCQVYKSETNSFTPSLAVEDGVVVESNSVSNETVDLAGAFIFPAFRDGHCHPLFAGREALGPTVTEDKSIKEIQESLRQFKFQNPDSTWIEGGAYDRSIVEEGKFLAAWLDEAIDDVPVVLHASDHHTIWVNTKALELAFGQMPLPELESGSIDVNQEGIPTGVLREPDAMKHVLDKAPTKTMEEEIKALAWADSRLAQFGVVEAQDAWIDGSMARVYIEATKSSILLLDYNLAFRIEPAVWKKSLEHASAERALVRELNHPKLSANTVKFFADGVFGSGTASVIEPYLEPSPKPYGEPLWTNGALQEACIQATKDGFQLHIHAIGDAGVRQALDVIEFTTAKLGSLPFPAVIAHAELIADSDTDRFSQLGVIANMQPLWAQKDGMLMSCLPKLGEDRIDQMYRMRDLIDSGAEISFGSDWPVSSANPLLGIATAVSRQTKDLEPSGGWVSSQALSIKEAILSYSQAVENQLGRLSNSPLSLNTKADFIVLDQNLLEISTASIRNLTVKNTYKSGLKIY